MHAASAEVCGVPGNRDWGRCASPQQNYRDLRSAYFVSYGALDFIERFSNGAGPMPPRGTILLTVRPVMYVTERGFALRVN